MPPNETNYHAPWRGAAPLKIEEAEINEKVSVKKRREKRNGRGGADHPWWSGDRPDLRPTFDNASAEGNSHEPPVKVVPRYGCKGYG